MAERKFEIICNLSKKLPYNLENFNQMKFRIAKRNHKYFPQVKKHWWSKWMKIAKHPGGSFGLYDDFEYGHALEEFAMDVIKEYSEWLQPTGISFREVSNEEIWK